jgi:alkanesulfonate monooxygenase SsuD/methylene tetrahydromethanopterin reductase-like flavin-dependent oxidoreductase (luciferase family)
MDSRLDPVGRAMLDDALAFACVGSAATVRQKLDAFVARTGADEIMATANIFEHDARKRSFEILAGIGRDLGAVRPEAAAGGGSEARANHAVRA